VIATIGAAIFLVGTIFFFRWAIEQGWIGREMRFALGLFAGGALTALATRNLLLRGERRLGVALLLAGLGTLQFTLRVGAVDYRFYAPMAGLVATAVITLFAGGLAARSRNGGALTVSLVCGVATPFVFSQGGHHEVALALYLGVLMAACLAVPYLAQEGARWHVTRWAATLGVWLSLLVACEAVTRADAAVLGALLIAHLILAGVFAWLPGLTAAPGTPTALWLVVSILATSYGHRVWSVMDLPPEGFAVPVLAAAGWNLMLRAPLRRRMGGPRADWLLAALAVGHITLAVPVALEWRWVGPLWGVFAVSLAWAAVAAERRPLVTEVQTLRRLAAALALLTTIRVLLHGFDGEPLASSRFIPIVNSRFAEGALASIAWYLLALRRKGQLAVASFIGLEIVANLTVAAEAARIVDWLRPPLEFGAGSSRAASVVMTLVWALSGAAQWMRGLPQRTSLERGLLAWGYVWMAISGLKLIGADLDQADTPLRALAFLGVGAIGMAAAVLASRRRASESSM
jgi:hypothetical protein